MSDIEKRITAYLSGGGLFNPEMANHDAVRDLLMDCRAENDRLHRVVEAARAVHDRCEHASNSGDEYAPTCPACDCWQSEPHKPGCSMDALRAALAALEGEGRE